MKLDQEKCHLLVSGNKFQNIWAENGHAKIWESPKQKLLGVVIDRDFSFDGYISSLWRKADKKPAVAKLETEEGFNKILYRSTIWLLPTDLDVSF